QQLKHVIEAPLIAGHTTANFICSPLTCFVHEFRVSQHSSSHADQIRYPFPEHLFRYERIVDPVAADNRDLDAFFDASRKVNVTRLRKIHGYLWNSALVPSSRHIDAISTRLLYSCSEDSRLPVGVTVRHEIISRYTDNHGHVWANFLPNA